MNTKVKEPYFYFEIPDRSMRDLVLKYFNKSIRENYFVHYVLKTDDGRWLVRLDYDSMKKEFDKARKAK
jgi:hypothetical protein